MTEVTVPAPDGGGPQIDADRLNFALDVALAARGRMTTRGWRPMTAEALAKEIGITEQSLSHLRRHGVVPTSHFFAALLAWLHLDVALFVQPAAPAPAGRVPSRRDRVKAAQRAAA